MRVPQAKIVSTKEVFNSAAVLGLGRDFIKIHDLSIKADAHDGTARDLRWLIVDCGNAVGVLGYDPRRDEVVLINEMRSGILAAGEYPYTANVVAGGLKTGEDPIAAARREWGEETSGTDELRDARIIHNAFTSSGRTSEKIAIVFGIVDTSKAGGVSGLQEESEDIRTLVIPAQDFIRRVKRGEISDFKTIAAGYWLADHRAQLRTFYAVPKLDVGIQKGRRVKGSQGK
jgi:ADP-ribose pyrophosphatase